MKPKYFVIIFFLSLACLISFVMDKRSKTAPESVDFKDFPYYIGPWKSDREIEMSEELIRILDPDAILFRDYYNSHGDKINLNIIYHLDQRYGAHDPEVCYTSQGWSIPYVGEKQTTRVSLGNGILNVNKFYVTKSGLKRVVFYWFFTSGENQTSSRFKQMMFGIKEKIIAGHIGTGFVRVSMFIDDDKKDVSHAMEKFSLMVYQKLEEFIPANI